MLWVYFRAGGKSLGQPKDRGNIYHPKVMALDFRSPAFGTPLAICQALRPRLAELGIGQIVFEHTWVHISTRAPANPANAVLTLAGAGYVLGIVR